MFNHISNQGLHIRLSVNVLNYYSTYIYIYVCLIMLDIFLHHSSPLITSLHTSTMEEHLALAYLEPNLHFKNDIRNPSTNPHPLRTPPKMKGFKKTQVSIALALNWPQKKPFLLLGIYCAWDLRLVDYLVHQERGWLRHMKYSTWGASNTHQNLSMSLASDPLPQHHWWPSELSIVGIMLRHIHTL